MGIGRLVNRLARKKVHKMNKIAKTVLMTGTALCVTGVVLSTAGYFAGEKISHILQIICMYPEEILPVVKILQ